MVVPAHSNASYQKRTKSGGVLEDSSSCHAMGDSQVVLIISWFMDTIMLLATELEMEHYLSHKSSCAHLTNLTRHGTSPTSKNNSRNKLQIPRHHQIQVQQKQTNSMDIPFESGRSKDSFASIVTLGRQILLITHSGSFISVWEKIQEGTELHKHE